MTADRIIEIFTEITKIPRESGNEAAVQAWLEEFASRRKLPFKKDSAGNVLIVRPASAGREKVAPIVLQAHQDMVCEKVAGSSHDFLADPIHFEIRDGWMVADETTLGADDGIGMAACLAVLESGLDCGEIQCLFTVSEETGMDGAMALQEGFFTGRTLINLDSEDEGQIFVGCAGGVTTYATFDYKRVPMPSDFMTLRLSVSGGTGGHSGDDINKGRANAVQLMARFLYGIGGKVDSRLVSFNGGGKHNAIARSCESVVCIPRREIERFSGLFESFASGIRAEYAATEPSLEFSCTEVSSAERPVEPSVAEAFISSLVAVHHGVLEMSRDIPGLVETSSNLASVDMTAEGRILICTSQRSSVDTAKDFVADKVEAAFRLAGAAVRRSDPYPGWKPDMNSPILAKAVSAYRTLFGCDPEVKAIHAGLECGLFLEKFPGLDMISIGPTLRGVHAPGEKLDLESNVKFARLLEKLVTC